MRTRYAVPGWGVGELWMLGRVVLAHDFDFGAAVTRPTATDEIGARPPKGAVSPPSGTLSAKSSHLGHAFVPTSNNGPDAGPRTSAHELAACVTEFLAGAAAPLDEVELDLTWATSFQLAVAEALRGVPRGQVVTYGELAALAGYPGAARAAGSFCATNRFALFVPCHRVVSAGGIGGYGTAGVGIKRRLLALEGVVV